MSFPRGWWQRALRAASRPGSECVNRIVFVCSSRGSPGDVRGDAVGGGGGRAGGAGGAARVPAAGAVPPAEELHQEPLLQGMGPTYYVCEASTHCQRSRDMAGLEQAQ